MSMLVRVCGMAMSSNNIDLGGKGGGGWKICLNVFSFNTGASQYILGMIVWVGILKSPKKAPTDF